MKDSSDAREAIQRLLNAYCFAIDAGDIDAFATLFAKGYWGVVGDPSGFQQMVFDTIIPRNIKLSEAPSFGMPAVLYDAESKGTISYLNLAREIINKPTV